MGPIRTVIVVVCACTWWSQIATGYDLSDPAEPWSALRMGDEKDVPATFEALRSKGSRIFMWERTCELGGLLPNQIENQSAPMFRPPPRVVSSVGSGRQVVESGWTDFTAQAELLKKRQAFVAASENLHFYRPHALPEWLQVRVEIERDGKLATGASVAGAYLSSEDNQLLLLVSNLSDQPGALRLHVAAIRGELGERIEVADALTGAPSLRANADGYLRLSIAAHTCPMLHVYPLKS